MIRALNVGAVTLALLLSTLAGLDWSGADERKSPRSARQAASLDWVEAEDGSRGIRDASGTVVPLRDYQRIVSGSTVADALLLELAAPERIAAYSVYAENSPLGPQRYGEKPLINPLEDLEGLLALEPDLLLLNTHGSPAKVARLERAGLPVFNLGQMNGLDAYAASARIVGALLGDEARGRDYARRFVRRMQRVSSQKASERTGLYVAIYGGKMFGGARHTSYDDVLTHAGLLNVAARKYEGWPEYDAERILELDPDVLVTIEGMREPLCRHPGLQQLRACAKASEAIVELPRTLISNPAAGMLPAAEALHDAVFGPPSL